MAVVKFASSQAGRIARALAGIVFITLGLWLVQGTLGVVLAILGLVPLVAGLIDICVLAPLLGGPLQGGKVRAEVAK